ncbi:MAG: (d)CMP kinase [Actinobacteria bacterium HGW-Actinobacteria-1]|jgi:cytidylate kinase|nr:MAG: (d)CMP kinase [Actinobacteria bacterium HGW-Actinobacteria-1]
MIIAIDGPAASGKSTVARAVARRLGFRYLDTGAMYRAIAAEAVRLGLPLEDAGAMAALAETTHISFTYAEGDPIPGAVLVGGADVTAEIRTPQVDAAVSLVARIPGVRAALVPIQRRFATGSDTVVEGRDIGTVVFPDAAVKVYLTATPEERARRRFGDREAAGHEAEIAAVAADIAQRDMLDSTRAASPLATAADAHVIDTTGLSVDGVVDQIEALVREAAI